MLAYVFWHRPREGVERARYEDALRRFHETLDVPSAAFRLRSLPFLALDGYEDWYLVEDWQRLGGLNLVAVDALRRDVHDRAADLAGDGWGGIYALVRGAATPPRATRWLAKPPGQTSDEFLGTLPNVTIWQRQMVLGPAPEFCIDDGAAADGREKL